jgi:hypothetical protein
MSRHSIGGRDAAGVGRLKGGDMGCRFLMLAAA